MMRVQGRVYVWTVDNGMLECEALQLYIKV